MVRPARDAEAVVGSGKLLLPQDGAPGPNFKQTAPFAEDFLTAMQHVQDFWQEPAYTKLLLVMQKRVYDYVVADNGTAKAALDLLIQDWTTIVKDEGKL